MPKKSLKQMQEQMDQIKDKLAGFEDGPEMFEALNKVWSEAAKTSSLMMDNNVKAAVSWLEGKRDYIKSAILMAPIEKTTGEALKGAILAYQVYDRFLAAFDPERLTVASDAFQQILDSDKLNKA